MILALVKMAVRADSRDVRPRSLKAASISALTTDVIIDNANFSHLSIQGNYSAQTSHDKAKINPR